MCLWILPKISTSLMPSKWRMWEWELKSPSLNKIVCHNYSYVLPPRVLGSSRWLPSIGPMLFFCASGEVSLAIYSGNSRLIKFFFLTRASLCQVRKHRNRIIHKLIRPLPLTRYISVGVTHTILLVLIRSDMFTNWN